MSLTTETLPASAPASKPRPPRARTRFTHKRLDGKRIEGKKKRWKKKKIAPAACRKGAAAYAAARGQAVQLQPASGQTPARGSGGKARPSRSARRKQAKRVLDVSSLLNGLTI